jgi:hypothetical protein
MVDVIQSHMLEKSTTGHRKIWTTSSLLGGWWTWRKGIATTQASLDRFLEKLASEYTEGYLSTWITHLDQGRYE